MITRAAAFNTRCNLSVTVLGAPARTTVINSRVNDSVDYSCCGCICWHCMCTVSVNDAEFFGRCSKRTVSRDSGGITSPSPSSRPVAPTSLPHAGDLGLRLAYEATDCRDKYGSQRGAVVSGVRRMNEVNARRARLVPGWVTVFGM